MTGPTANAGPSQPGTPRNRLILAHAALEESIAAAFFPRWALRWLRSEHKRLRARGFPPAEVRRHAAQEIRYFEKYAPWTVARLEREHDQLENGARHEIG
jgi:hypothetical protein